MDIFKLIKKDHTEIKTFIKELKKANEDFNEGGDRKTLFDQFKKLVQVHSKAEESAVYVPMETAEEAKTRLMTFKNADEHHLVDTLFQKMEGLDCGEERWVSGFNLIKQLLEEHIKAEESAFFSKMKKSLDKEDLDRVAEDFIREREKLIGDFESVRPHVASERDIGLLFTDRILVPGGRDMPPRPLFFRWFCTDRPREDD